MRATLPQFLEMEEKHGSLIHAMKSTLRPTLGGAKTKPSMFTSLRGGLGTLVDRLVASIGEERIRTGVKLSKVSALKDDPRGRFAVEVGGETRYADDVVLAVPGHAAPAALESFGERLTSLLSAMPYVSTAVVMLGFARADVPYALDATGYIVPRVLGRPALAATWVSSKWDDRAPDGQVLIRVFLGGAGQDELMAKDDEQLGAIAALELSRTMGVTATPTLVRVFRFVRASPQPLVGHPGRMRRAREILGETPGLYLVASGYDGVGLPDCVRQAEAAAKAIVGSPT